MNVLERIKNKELTVIVINETEHGGIKDETGLGDSLVKLAEIGQQMQWISVENRLPTKEACWVLVYSDGAMNCMAYYNGEWKDWTHQTVPNIKIDEITHWMKLPQPPI